MTAKTALWAALALSAAVAALAPSGALAQPRSGLPAPPAAPAAPPAIPAIAAVPAIPSNTVTRRFNAREVQLRDFVGIVTVIPEARADIELTFSNPGPLPGADVRTNQRKLVIDGQLDRQIQNCRVENRQMRVNVRRRGWIDENHMPRIQLRVPNDVVLASGGASRIHVGHSQSANVSLTGCGDADLEGVANAAEISVAGGMDVRLYEAGSAEVRIAGAGDVTLGAVHSGLTISVAGAGDVVAARADGPLNIAVQGAGDVTIRDGRTTAMSVMIAGSGDVRHGGEAERLDVAIFGGGDVSVRRVSGPVTRRVLGGGEVSVGS